MKISYNWLIQYLDIELSVKQICDTLTHNGLQAEYYKEINTLDKSLEVVILGKIYAFYAHPYVQDLNIILVDIGKDHILQIICGYINIFIGKKVIIAPIGGLIIDSTGKKKKIERININGIFSYGFICNSKNLGLEDDNILFICNNKLPGTQGKEFLKIRKDYCLEIEMTPNRIDAMSHWGIAREIYATLKIQRSTVLLHKPSVKKFKSTVNLNKLLISINDIEKCKRYSSCIIDGVKITPSNVFLQNRLQCIGLQTHNNVIDTINFVIHEFGHPIHGLDIDDIDGKEIHIKKLQEKVIIHKSVDKELKINSKDLMVCDAKKPLGIAGTFCSNIQKTTKNIFLDCAYFETINTLKNVKKHGINTYSSFLFQRGVDPDQIIYIIKRVAILLKQISGGDIYTTIDIYPKDIQRVKTIIRYKKIHSIIGKKISKQSIKKIISLLEIDILIEKKQSLVVSIPSYRVDVLREVDLIEEILRIFGHKNIKTAKAFFYFSITSKKNTFKYFENDVSVLLNSQGFYEVINLSLTKREYIKFLDLTILSSSMVKLINSYNKELAFLRETLLFGLIEKVSFNVKRNNLKLKFFEWGKTYKKIENIYNEKYILGLIITGKEYKNNWLDITGLYSFFYLKGVIEGILKKNGIRNIQQNIKKDVILENALWFFHNDIPIAKLGRIKNKIIESFDIKQDVFYAEIYYTIVFNIVQNYYIHFNPISQLPGVHRDLALLLAKRISYEEVYQIIKSTREEIIKDIQLFDVHEVNNLQKYTKSFALSFYLEDNNKNLSEIEIEKTMINIQKILNKKLGVLLR